MTRFAKKLYVKQSLKREYCVTETGWTLHGKVWLVFRTCQFIVRLSTVHMHSKFQYNLSLILRIIG